MGTFEQLAEGQNGAWCWEICQRQWRVTDLAGHYCLSLIAGYVPKHSSCIWENCKIFDVKPARQTPGESGKSVWEENWQLSKLTLLKAHFPSLGCLRGKTPRRLTVLGERDAACTSWKRWKVWLQMGGMRHVAVDSSAALRTGSWVFFPTRPGVCGLQFYQERMVWAAPANELRTHVKEFTFCSLAQPTSCVSSKSSKPFHDTHLPDGKKATANHSSVHESRL